jgi:anti-anti-sigma regulatory factor
MTGAPSAPHSQEPRSAEAELLAARDEIASLKARLAESERQREELRLLFEDLPIGVMVVDGQDRSKRVVNRKGRELFGTERSPGSVLICSPGTEQPVDPSELPAARAHAQKAPARGDFELVEKEEGDGARRASVEILAAPVLDAEGSVLRVIAVSLDASSRRLAEQERARVQDELIRTQEALLLERGSPLIPISEDILVMPLVGAVDVDRGSQMLDALLVGVSRSQARFAILDITGVRTVDTNAACAISNAAQALRLLGVEAILTGIRAEVAQTLVGLGVSLAGITTCATLQRGIAHAQKRLAGRDGR